MVLSKSQISQLVIFNIANSLYFSNLIGEKSKVLNMFTVSSLFTLFALVLSIFLLNGKYIYYAVTVVMIVFINFVLEQGISSSLLMLTIKCVSLIAVWVAIDYLETRKIFRIVLYSFLVSNICALMYLSVGLNEFRQVLYPGIPPRYAGLAIEPAGFSLGSLALVYLLYLSRPKIHWLLVVISYIPFILAISSSILVKGLLDITKHIRISIVSLLYIVLLCFIGIAAFINTRIGLSIITRFELYEGQIEDIAWTILGKGYGLEEYAALPGLLKFPIETGIIFSISAFLFLFYAVINKKLYKNLIFLPIFATPFITETYGAALLWVPIFVMIKKGYVR